MFMCQRDSFLKRYETEVVSCESVDTEALTANNVSIDPKVLNGKKLYKLILKDTILFPEGGGQPDDRGTIAGEGTDVSANVVRVLRNGSVAEHYVVASPSSFSNGDKEEDQKDSSFIMKSGDKVSTNVDFNRRFDHMQQHSGQHLITAVADKLYGYATTSWWLGSEESNIELDTKDITKEQLGKIEDEVNMKIREGVPVQVDVVSLDDPKLKARGRNLPEDVKGNIRIVTMTGVESNVCCGTHVTNLSQLQVIKLLHVVKKKGKCLLHFLAGNRVITKFEVLFQREQKLVEILKSSPNEFPEAAQKLNISLKNCRKSTQLLSRDLAASVAKEFVNSTTTSTENSGKLWMYHRDNAELDFGMALLRELGSAKDSKIILITIKTDGNAGCLLLTGAESVIQKDALVQAGEQLCSILDGKGSLQRGNLYQAKVNKMNALAKAQKLAEQLLGQDSS